MTYDQFWNLIADSRRDLDSDRKGEPMEGQARRMKKILSAMPVAEVAEFRRIFCRLFFDAYRWDLWAAAYILDGGCSDCGFMYFRYWLISMGRQVYEEAMADPESLIGVDGGGPYSFEEFGAVDDVVLHEMGEPEPPDTPEFRHPEEPTGQPWEIEDMPVRFPKLTAARANPPGRTILKPNPR